MRFHHQELIPSPTLEFAWRKRMHLKYHISNIKGIFYRGSQIRVWCILVWPTMWLPMFKIYLVLWADWYQEYHPLDDDVPLAPGIFLRSMLNRPVSFFIKRKDVLLKTKISMMVWNIIIVWLCWYFITTHLYRLTCISEMMHLQSKNQSTWSVSLLCQL